MHSYITSTVGLDGAFRDLDNISSYFPKRQLLKNHIRSLTPSPKHPPPTSLLVSSEWPDAGLLLNVESMSSSQLSLSRHTCLSHAKQQSVYAPETHANTQSLLLFSESHVYTKTVKIYIRLEYGCREVQ